MTGAPIITAAGGSRRAYPDRVRDAARMGQPFPLPDTGSRYQARLDRRDMMDRVELAARDAWRDDVAQRERATFGTALTSAPAGHVIAVQL